MQPGRLSARLAARDNNFDVVRIAAATAVMVSHAFAFSGLAEPHLPGASNTLGECGVFVFFALSGFLVARSWAVCPEPSAFFAKRALRIYPALLVVLLLSAYALGPVATSLPIGAYLTSWEPVRYVASGLLMDIDYTLPGVFEGNVLDTVNGSLGTLPAELKAYVLLVVGGTVLATARTRPFVAGGGCLLFAALGYLATQTGVKPPAMVLTLLAIFAGGVAFYALRERVVLSLPLALLAGVAWVASYKLPEAAHIAVAAVAIPYGVLYLGFHLLDGLRWLAAPGDVSYGLYVYAFPVQQAVVAITGWTDPLAQLVVAVPVVYASALASWRLVERPALRFKPSAAAPPEPRATAPQASVLS